MQYPLSWIELSSSAFAHNAHLYDRIRGSQQIGFVVKSNAYGHGLREITSLAEKNSAINSFCVATLSDALALRAHGIRKPILVMSTIDTDPVQALAHDIDLVVYHDETAQMLSQLAAAHGRSFRIHIKVDTGLSRLGVLYTNALEFVQSIQKLPHLIMSGIFSHFSESNEIDQTFTLLQVSRFNAVLESLANCGIDIPLRHCANTAAAMTLDLPLCTMTRIGAGLLGLWPSAITQERTLARYPDFHLKPVLTLKTRIINIKTVPAGSFIGYARTLQAPTATRLAQVPLGYYEGYDFRLANQAVMHVRDAYAPVAGRISMNLTTLDVTHIPDVALGDEVIVMGAHPHITPYELNTLRGNPNVREIHTRLNPAIPRIIV